MRKLTLEPYVSIGLTSGYRYLFLMPEPGHVHTYNYVSHFILDLHVPAHWSYKYQNRMYLYQFHFLNH